MTSRPVIFISAVSKELRSARDLVANTLLALGYEPKWQNIAPTDSGDLRAVLRKWIDSSDAVLQLVGHCYGFGPKDPDPEFGSCSYTQYEAIYAARIGKPVYYLLLDDDHTTDGCGCEPPSLHDLQAAYRQRVTSTGDLYHRSASVTETELTVRRMRDDLDRLRRRGTQTLSLILGLLLVLVLGGVWLMRGQDDLKQQNKQLINAVADIRQMREYGIKGGSEQKAQADYDAALRFIAHKRGLSLEGFQAYLDENATRALGDRRLPLNDKVRALLDAGQFAQARDFAIENARRLEAERQQEGKEEVELWTEAAKTELSLGHYPQALEHAQKAVSLTSPEADFQTWSAARHTLGWALIYMGKNKEAQALYESLLPQQEAALGADDLAVLQSRQALAVTIYYQGNYVVAEQQNRALVADCERVLGAEHRDTLGNRSNLALVLNAEGKHFEAELENRARIAIEERVLGAEHPDTLMSRVILAIALDEQGKHGVAEDEYRAVLAIQERVQGAEHPDAFWNCYHLARCLEAQQKLKDALAFALRAEQGDHKVLGPDHPSTKEDQALVQRLKAALKLPP